ncbi:MAG: helix-hairpin-helix domain-containing protein [Eubacterium sp.]|nr:helix-hairpin-helix domain-containing protein [Eubacterium sp.]
MKSDKNQTLTLIGIALLIIAGVLIFVSLSQPRIYETDEKSVSSVSRATAKTEQAARSVQTSEKPSTQTETTAPEFPLDINKASLSELSSDPGLGEKKASAIIEYRNVIGRYKDVSQIMEISGFGEATYERVAPYLTV